MGTIVLAIIITAVVVGGGVYYWQTQNSTKISPVKKVTTQTTASDNKEVVTQTTPDADLEKTIISEKDKLFRAYDSVGKELSSGYPVIFSNTTDSAVRYTRLTNSGGDAMHTTLYYINQAKKKILQIDTDVSGGDFGASGNLTLSLNDGSVAVISREQAVNSEKREITYKGLQVNKTLNLTFKNPIIWEPKSPLEFTVLGVSPDLNVTYFSDGLKQFSYNIVSNKLQEVTELPAIAKPIAK